MTWIEQLKAHLQKTSDLWVDKNREFYQVCPDSESRAIRRKKESLKERQTQIIKANVIGNVLGTTSYGERRTVEYSCYLSLLHKQKGEHFYVEETLKRKKATFNDGQLIQDETLEWEGSQEKTKGLSDQRLSLSSDELRLSERSKAYQYDRLQVVKYADRWWNTYNPEFKAFDVDCTNYISQCVHAGGVPMTGKYNKHSGWWFEQEAWSLSWAVAHSFRWYLSSDQNIHGAITVDKPEDLQPGDVICYDFEGDGHWDHSTVVTEKDANNMPLVNAHTTNSRHRYWAYEDSSAWTPNIQYKFFHITD
ncbi:hypothetical protein JOD43_003761 [Pullulanibacillus pueri]|uniref:Putative amidase domain-containing protein n=1 Tax=Pullulanibacillus pueri TaxID=1437324 RepID=A0A8J2ZX03_9BACL|nr:amidase domain-containing protein [Pullulanibacillus pueri]MBM7683581.1 hypothetical protein [Pullulanibacillus pueri]GGH84500.1 hypothetical protein GCM10007096_27720 [Pullulanibacillus pueri]